jgi:hypothetical protein
MLNGRTPASCLPSLCLTRVTQHEGHDAGGGHGDVMDGDRPSPRSPRHPGVPVLAMKAEQTDFERSGPLSTHAAQR